MDNHDILILTTLAKTTSGGLKLSKIETSGKVKYIYYRYKRKLSGEKNEN